MNVIRWKGLIPFAIIVTGLWVGGWLFADTLARVGLERSLTRINGAQVDIAQADVRWQPLGIQLTEIAITDPEQPQRNSASMASVVIALDGLAMLTGKWVLEAVTVDGLQFGTLRQTPGRVLERPAPEQKPEDGENRLAALTETVDLPSPQQALARHGGLITDARGQALQDTWEQVDLRMRERASMLPTEDRLAEHRARIQALENSSMSSLQEARAVRRELEMLTLSVAQDRQSMVQFVRAIDESEDALRSALAALASGPQEDWAAIMATYNLSSEGQVALIGLLLGDQWAEWLTQGQHWYGKAEPWLQRMADRRSDRADNVREQVRGYFVFFPEENPQPRFWLKEARLSALFEDGAWQIKLTDWSSDQAMVKAPARLLAESSRLPQADNAAVQLTWDLRAEPRLEIAAQANNWRVGGWQLANPDFPLGLAKAQTTVELAAVRTERWAGQVDWVFASPEFGMPSSWGSRHPIRQALTGISAFSVEGSLAGAQWFPSVRWSSDLDDQVKASITDQANAQLAAWQRDIEAELRIRQQALAAPIQQELARLDGQRTLWVQRQQALEDDVLRAMAGTEQRVVSQIRNLEDTAASELRALEAAVEAEREALERAATEERERLEAAAEAERRRLEREAEQRARDAIRNRLF